MFVGDSLSLNMWESLACMIHASVPNSKTSYVRQESLSSVTFQVINLSPHNIVCFKDHVSMPCFFAENLATFFFMLHITTPKEFLHKAVNSGFFQQYIRVLYHMYKCVVLYNTSSIWYNMLK